ncbi:MAG TPA: pyridoxal-phosphate dependent enzyme [Capillimicrobium sp.]|nr:pyridoxal-phosphate dependent enzyme [Capillimicrobium sp.]
MIELADVQAAARRLEGVAHRTPVVRSRTLDARVGAEVVLKAESLQRVGAFKFRGAYNALASMPEAERARGVVCASSGNHAQAVALAARLHGVPCVAIMPHDAPASKVAATAGYGAELVRYDRYEQDRDELLLAEVAARGMARVHAYDDERVMAGQGTVALELLDEAPDVDLLVVPVGGGGLVSGCSTVVRALRGDAARVVGVEPEAGDDVRRSLAAGERVSVPVPRTIADGQQTSAPGELTFPVIRERVDAVEVVSDDEIVAAMRFLFERCKLVAEPSGACALAALLAGRVALDGARRVGVVVSGGNVDAARFASLVG